LTVFRFLFVSLTISEIQLDNKALISQIQTWARELGFSQIGVTGVDLSSAEPGLLSWLANGFHGDMAYMAAHGLKRARPAELVPGTVSVLTARMDYLPRSIRPMRPMHPQMQHLMRDWTECGIAAVATCKRSNRFYLCQRTRLPQGDAKSLAKIERAHST
jgi:hypothetical protein